MKDSVVIYQVDLRDWNPKKYFLLTAADFDEVSCINNEEKRIEALASKYLKRKYVGRFYVDESGKPKSLACYFSIAHSKQLALCAVCKTNFVGIDIEQIKELNSKVVAYTLSDEELASIETNSDFFRLWTLKESLAKCEGSGITHHTKDVPAVPTSGVCQYLGESYYRKSWIDHGYAYALALKGNSEFNYQLINDQDVEIFYGSSQASSSLCDLYLKILGAWGADTCAPRMRKEWDYNHPSYGQCSVTAFLVQAYFGGAVRSIDLPDGSKHCFNVIDGKVFDLTSRQFDNELDYSNSEIRNIEELYANSEKYQRFLLLKSRIIKENDHA